MAIFDFRDASIKGDRQWASASSWTGYAPIVVINLLVLSIIEIVIGVIWIISIQSSSDNLSFSQVVQPLIIPGLSFFNTIPSLHLHVLARSNTPVMAISFSSIMGVIYLASAIIFLPACTGNSNGSYRQAECPAGNPRGIWAAQVALQFISALLYFVHVAMAVKVRSVVKRQERDEREGRVMVVIDEEAKARREEEARARWREIRDL